MSELVSKEFSELACLENETLLKQAEVHSLEARITFLESLADHTEWLHAAEIARQLDTYDNEVIRVAEKLGIQFESRYTPQFKREIKYYPPYTSSLVLEEREWKRAYRSLPAEVDLTTITENLGRSRGWVTKTIGELGARPIVRQGVGTGRRVLYRKNILNELRTINMAAPLDNGWYNLNQLVEYTGADREWIERRLKEASYTPQRRRSSLTGKISDFYSPDSVHELMKTIEGRAGPAGSWLTAHAITGRVDRSSNWVLRRLGEHDALSQDLQDDQGVTRKHYAPRIVDYLQEESARLRALPRRKDTALSIHQVARKLGHATEWAINILEEMNVKPDEAQDRKGRAQRVYPVTILDEIRKYEENNTSREQVITRGEILESQFAVDSIRAKIRMQRKLLGTYRQYGEEEKEEEVLEQINAYKAELKLVRQRHYRMLARITMLPGFITGKKTVGQAVE